MSGAGPDTAVRGPFFEELHRGQRFDTAPSVTLTSGLAAAHRAVIGSRLRLPLDARSSRAVAGGEVASPDLVWDVVIGQSTLATQNVRANLFYRGLMFARIPYIGDTIKTVTVVEKLRQNALRPGRPATGMAVLRVHAVDQEGRSVLDFQRCAMLPLGDPAAETGCADDVAADEHSDANPDVSAFSQWDLDAFRASAGGAMTFDDIKVGDSWCVTAGDVVSSAPELARLTMNIAAVHHDARAAGGERLVYGGHTIGLAFAQLTRALPDIVGVVGWHSCSHLAPVHEGDTLSSRIEVQGRHEVADGGVLDLRVTTSATRPDGSESAQPVLEWRPAVLLP